MKEEPFRVPLVEFPPDALVEIIQWLTPQRLAAFIDATDLKADTREPKIHKLVGWATRYGCSSVCVNPVEVDLLPDLLRSTSVKECYVIDFPLGKSTIEVKAHQAAQVVARSRAMRGEGPGWVELDMVINVGRFKRDPDYTRREIGAVVEAADGEHVKVIIRSSELLEEEIVAVCQIAREAGAHFVKNSTGMDAFGATPDHIRLMREAVGPEMGVKAAGGIRDAMDVIRLIYAGAMEPELRTPDRFRIGTSGPVNLLSTLGWLKQAPCAWAEAGVIPCTVCPSNFTGKQRREVREVYMQKCRRCPHQAYRKDKDF
ncbi:MAG TPA: deoxyribose-phosphate aldolase [Anaerolineales bacterium]|nr:deoxyribose-phosphate aldolase [Anaerolineae bacterium]HIQ01934.1 deoxyribose-phosphate aldolase [Anaerolineales bacterium]